MKKMLLMFVLNFMENLSQNKEKHISQIVFSYLLEVSLKDNGHKYGIL